METTLKIKHSRAMKNEAKSFTFPPNSLDELRLIIVEKQNGNLDLPMGKASERAVCSMLDNPKLVTMDSITSLADALDISPSSLSRISKMLGFSGFKSFQHMFRSQPQQQSHYYSRQLKKYASTSSSIISGLISQSIKQQEAIEDSLDQASLDRICRLIKKAPRVHCFGYRQSFSLSSYLSYGLGMIRQGVQLLNGSGQGLAYSLGQLRTQDLLIGFSFKPYSSTTVRMMQVAKRSDIPMIVFTDSYSSPLASLATEIVRIPTESDFYSNTMTSVVLTIEIILSLLAHSLGQKAIEQLQKREEFIEQINDEY